MRFAIALILSLAAAPALAVPDQMLRQIYWGLRSYQIRIDVNTLTNAQATAIWFELTSEDEHSAIDRLRKRQRLLNIIRRGEKK